MPKGERGPLRANAFLVAAAALPLAVVGLFLLAAAIPRWSVPLPQYDLVLRVSGPHGQTPPRVSVEFFVRNSQVVATVGPVPANTNAQPASLFVFDHETLQLRTIQFDIPQVTEATSPLTVPVERLRGWTVLDQPVAPDGYAFENRTNRGPGIVGELFGMNRYEARAALVKDGRVIPITVPASGGHYYPPMTSVGWVTQR